MNPCGLNSNLFFTSPHVNTFVNMAFSPSIPSSSSSRDDGGDGEKDILGNAIQVWAERSREMGFEREAESVAQMSIVAHQSSHTLACHSIRANQMCRSVICDTELEIQMMRDLTPLLINGCCYKLYNRILCMLQGLKPTDVEDKLKLSRVISFLDSDREFMRVIKAHQNIEDVYQTFHILISRLKQAHVTETLGERRPQQTNAHETNSSRPGKAKTKNSEITSMLYYYYPCGGCNFHYTMAPL